MRVLLIESSLIKNMEYPLRKKERGYLSKVLRLEDGVNFTCKDENENYYIATLSDSTLFLTPTENIENNLLDNLSGYNGSRGNLNLYIALLKGKKNERVVNDATQLGVKKITFIETEFSNQKELSLHDRERILLIAKEAVQQSGSAYPEIVFEKSFMSAINEARNIFLLHQDKENESKSLYEALKDMNEDDEISLFIGSEGGFSEKEINFARKNNATLVLLKTNILRAETASIYALGAAQSIILR